ncbi:somatostatin receptor type 5-like [Heptranchias perlo]|uniref:somatostatin receptor type 5-like n=1 Tax=Heptranchias perlo TaxID=212740 RepID=UPI00355A6C03
MDGLNETATGSYVPSAPTANSTGHGRSLLIGSRIAVPLLDSLVFVTGLAGHVLVTLILLRRKRQRNCTTLLLLNLTAADLLQLACLPFTAASIASSRWAFGSFLCKLVSFTGTACSSASVFTLTALSVNRYAIVAHPTRVYRSHRGGWLPALALLAVWPPALCLAVPQFVYRHLELESMYCFAFLAQVSVTVYSVSLFLTGFVAPLLVITAMHSEILRYLHRRRGSFGRLDGYNAQVTRMTVVLVLAFTVCWLPSYVLMFLLVSVSRARLAGPFAIFARFLASSSTVANPVVYAFFSKQFQSDLRRLATAPCSGRTTRNKVRPIATGAGITLQGGNQPVLREVAVGIVDALVIILQNSLDSAKVPAEWKTANNLAVASFSRTAAGDSERTRADLQVAANLRKPPTAVSLQLTTRRGQFRPLLAGGVTGATRS